MTHTKDETLRIALEALEKLKRAFFKNASTAKEIEQGCDRGYEDYEAEFVEPALKAITTIRQALAAPTVQEPVGVFVEDDDIGHVRLIPHQQMKLKDGDKLYTASPAQPAPDLQVELDATNRQVEILSDALAESRRELAALKANAALDKKAENARELGLDYEPVPLTDEQIDVLRESKSKGRGAGWRFDFKGFARSIEAAHGITKKGQQ